MATENKIPTEMETVTNQIVALLRAARISLALILMMLAFTCVRAGLSAPRNLAIADDIMGSDPSSAVRFILGNSMALLVSTALLAALGFGWLILDRKRERGIVAATVVILVLFVQWQAVEWAVQSPLEMLVEKLGAPEK